MIRTMATAFRALTPYSSRFPSSRKHGLLNLQIENSRRMSDLTFKDKVCIVTGSSSGIGEDIALSLAKKGASVTLCGRDEARLSAVQTSCIEVTGGQADRFLCVAGDLLTSSTRKDTVQKTVEKFGRLDVLVANAGVADAKEGILAATEQSYDKVMDTNVKSVFFMIQEAVPHLEKTQGNIVAISSVVSKIGTTANITYPMSKAAIDHMVRCLAVDLGPSNIRVNAVNPGFIPTMINRHLSRYLDASAEELNKINVAISAAQQERQCIRQPLTKQCVSECVTFLASDRAQFVTGQCLMASGGREFGGPSPLPSSFKN